MKYQSLFFFKFVVNVKIQRAFWEANFHKKRTCDLKLQNLLVLGPYKKVSQPLKKNLAYFDDYDLINE